MVDTKLTKSIGEHWTCSVLAGLGWAVALTRDGLERTDILAAHAGTGRMIEVQVKTAKFRRAYNWPLGEKGCLSSRPECADREWYVLVGLAENPWDAHHAWVVPRDHVAAATWISHMSWLTDSRAAIGKRNAPISRARVHNRVFSRYEGRWDLLSQPANGAPVMLPVELREWAASRPTCGSLPVGHPWLDAMPAWKRRDVPPHHQSARPSAAWSERQWARP